MTADAMSRPPGVPVAEAYRPSIEIAALKESMVNVTPQDIFQAQSESREIENILQKKHSPRLHF